MAAKEWDAAAAEAAGAEFKTKVRDDMTVAEFRTLWFEYFMKCGHKILARILIEPLKGSKPRTPTEVVLPPS